eukprot:TRINITY_DN1955_c1_g1_i1.p2 TRINITY_DN1955_c1_g1~~TRINITY_DN1955_c1_g1_i1.p2  ORF type:complete len:102 (-),score=18.19 TRINITY_DN1955_c1_g1_i1:839-1144(-)
MSGKIIITTTKSAGLPEPHLHIEVQEDQKYSPIEHRIEHPSTDTVTTPLHKMQQQHPNMANKVAPKQQHLTIHHERKTSSGQPDSDPKSVPINHRINQSRQ